MQRSRRLGGKNTGMVNGSLFRVTANAGLIDSQGVACHG